MFHSVHLLTFLEKTVEPLCGLDCTQQHKVVSLLGFLGTRVRIRNGFIGLLDNRIRPSFEVHAVLFVGCIGSKCMYQLHRIQVADSVQNWVPRRVRYWRNSPHRRCTGGAPVKKISPVKFGEYLETLRDS